MFFTMPSITWPSSSLATISLRCSARVSSKYRTARDHDVAAPAIHFQDLEWLGRIHQRADIADRTDVDLAAWQKRHGAVEIHRKAALDAAEDHALDPFALLELLLQPDPAFLAPRLLARQHRLTERVFHALQIDFDGVANGELRGRARARQIL